MNSISMFSIGAVAVMLVVSHCSVVMSDDEDRTFLEQISVMNDSVETWYKEEDTIASRVNHALHLDSEARLQSNKYHWPKLMLNVLQMATGVSSSSAIERPNVARILDGLKRNDESVRQEFLGNLEKYLATKYSSDDKRSGKQKENVFITELDKLCAPYRPKSKLYFYYGEAVDDLLDTKLKEQISDEEFFERVVYTNEPVAQLYSAAMLCAIYYYDTDTKVDGSNLSIKFDFTVSGHDNHSAVQDWPFPSFDAQRWAQLI